VRTAAPLAEEREVGRGDRAEGVSGHRRSLAAVGGAAEEEGGGVAADAWRRDEHPALVLLGLEIIGARLKPSTPVNQAIASS
jgi:hypothetical protein